MQVSGQNLPSVWEQPQVKVGHEGGEGVGPWSER